MYKTDCENQNKKTDEANFSGSNCAMASTSRQQRATHYNMNHKNRGIAMIFNHEEFELGSLTKRLGTDSDELSLEVTLANLGFTVKKYKNNNFSDLTKRISEVAAFDHTDYDCFVMAVLTHGETHDILYANDTCYKSETLWLPFCADQCPTLKGKPKLFFFQACQGTNSMPFVNIEADVPSNSSYKIPSLADFLFAYSSMPGYMSFRDPESGSWFIQTLCREFATNAYKYDLLTLLTFVIQSVAIDREGYLENKLELGEQKQLPCMTSTLMRLVQFKSPEIKPDNNVSSGRENVQVQRSEEGPSDYVDTGNNNLTIKESKAEPNNNVSSGKENAEVQRSEEGPSDVVNSGNDISTSRRIVSAIESILHQLSGEAKPDINASTSKDTAEVQKSEEESSNSVDTGNNNLRMEKRFKTLYGFKGENDIELSFEPNQIITNVKPLYHHGWVLGTINGETGIIPESFIKELP